MIPLICGICRQPVDLLNLANHKCEPQPKKLTRREFIKRIFKQ